jgi:hypothetical protein
MKWSDQEQPCTLLTLMAVAALVVVAVAAFTAVSGAL